MAEKAVDEDGSVSIFQTKYKCSEHGTFIIMSYYGQKKVVICCTCERVATFEKMETLGSDPLADM